MPTTMKKYFYLAIFVIFGVIGFVPTAVQAEGVSFFAEKTGLQLIFAKKMTGALSTAKAIVNPFSQTKQQVSVLRAIQRKAGEQAVTKLDPYATTAPTQAYMNAMDKAMQNYLRARARAGSNKIKLDQAEQAYIEALEAADELLIPVAIQF